jgi:tight adherence protein C
MPELTIALLTLFASLALLAGSATSALLSRNAPGRRRLLAPEGGATTAGVFAPGQRLADAPTERQQRLIGFIPKSPKEMSRLQRRLAGAGLHGYTPVVVYLLGQWIAAALGFAAVFVLAGLRTGWLFGLAGALIGYLIPGYIVARRVRIRRKQIQNGLPDALDLLIVSLEAGLALDQAVLKCSEELAIAYPALSHELQMVNIETRAGKPRIEALKNFAKRTRVDDVRALVAMLAQTDRFGTSVAQALRTHAEEARVKRRQRAEEAAAKLSVKLIFPLVFCLLPAFFVVAVGPGLIKFVDLFSNMQIGGELTK